MVFDTWDRTDSVHSPDRGPFGLDRTINNPTSQHKNFKITKLVDFIQSDLKNNKNYLQIVKNFIEIPKIKHYLNNNIIFTPMDFPGQYNIRKLIVNKIATDNIMIPREII